MRNVQHDGSLGEWEQSLWVLTQVWGFGEPLCAALYRHVLQRGFGGRGAGLWCGAQWRSGITVQPAAPLSSLPTCRLSPRFAGCVRG